MSSSIVLKPHGATQIRTDSELKIKTGIGLKTTTAKTDIRVPRIFDKSFQGTSNDRSGNLEAKCSEVSNSGFGRQFLQKSTDFWRKARGHKKEAPDSINPSRKYYNKSMEQINTNARNISLQGEGSRKYKKTPVHLPTCFSETDDLHE